MSKGSLRSYWYVRQDKKFICPQGKRQCPFMSDKTLDYDTGLS